MTNVETQSGNPKGAALVPRDAVVSRFPRGELVDTVDLAAIRFASEQEESEHFLGVRAAGLAVVVAVNDNPVVHEREAGRLLDDVSGETLDTRAEILHGIIEHSRLNGAVEANIILRAQRDAAIERAEGIVAIVRDKYPELVPEFGSLAEKPISISPDLTSATAVIEQVLADSAARSVEAVEHTPPTLSQAFLALGDRALSHVRNVFPRRSIETIVEES